MNTVVPAKSAFASGTLQTHEEILRLLEQGEDQHAALASLLQEIELLPDDHPERASLRAAVRRALAIGQRLEQHRQNELSLRGVFESAQALTELKELNEVLFEIVERGRRLLGCDLAWLSGVNPDNGTLFVLAVSGVYSNETIKTNSPLNGGVAGHVLSTRSPFATSHYMDDARFVHTPESDALIEGEGLVSLVAAPLLSGAEVTGVLLVGDRYTRTYHPREISILATLAAHAAVAVRNARAFDMTRRALFEAEQANVRLKEQTAALELAAEAHEQFTKLLAKGATLKELILTVANTLDGRVMYLDAAGIEVCVATPADYETPEVIGNYRSVSGMESTIQSAIGQSRVTGKAIPAQSPAGLHCQVAAVMSKDELFGALVIQTRTPMSEQAVRVFERSATATAVLQLSADKMSATRDQDINFTMRSLLEARQHPDSDISTRLERHGIDVSQPMLLAMIRIEKTKTGYLVRRLSGRLRQRPLIAAEIDGHIVMLINHAADHRLEDELHTLLFDELSFPGVASVSGPHASLGVVAGAYPHLERTIALLRALKRENCVVHEASLRMYALLFEHQSAEEVEATIHSVAGRLFEHDARRNTQLADTLHAYLDNMQNARVTAGVLQIHVNTLHNRLDAIRTLLGAWDTDGRVAEIHLALRLHRLKQDMPAARGRRTA